MKATPIIPGKLYRVSLGDGTSREVEAVNAADALAKVTAGL